MSGEASAELRVLHSVDPFLNISENWIYPQVARIPGVVGLVLCQALVNQEAFPVAPERIVKRRGYPPQRFPFQLASRIAARLRLDERRTVRKLEPMKPQLVHAHFGLQGFRDLGLAELLRLPLVTSFYGYDAWRAPQAEPAWRQRFRTLFGRGRLFLVEGPAMKERLLQLGCPEDKLTILRIGVDVEALAYSERSFDSPLRILMVGRFTEKKGFADGLEACARAFASGTDLSVTIVGDAVAGDPASEAIKRKLQQIAEAAPLAGRVRFAGVLSPGATRELLARHDVLLCPSRHAADGDAEGGAPVVLIEGMAQGLLCVATRHCDIPSLIEDGTTGFLRAEGDVEALAQAISGLPRSKARLLGITHAARLRVEGQHSLDKQLRDQAALYRSLIPSMRSPG